MPPGSKPEIVMQNGATSPKDDSMQSFVHDHQEGDSILKSADQLPADTRLSRQRDSREVPAVPIHGSTNVFTAPRPVLAPLNEYHSGFADGNTGLSQHSQHSRQSSYSGLISSLRSRTPSPTRRAGHPSDHMPLTGDGRPQRRDSTKSAFSGWLSGTSAAVNGNGEDKRPGTSRDLTPDTTPIGSPGRRKPTVGVDSPTKSAVTATASRFMSAISSRFTQSPQQGGVDDDLYNLNVEAALFPPGSPSTKDPFSPAALKNLQQTATGLLHRMQSAYRERVNECRALEAEKDAQSEELEEAMTRARHLKSQLEDMALKAQEQKHAMQQLADELVAEKKARLAERRFAHDKGLAVVTEGGALSPMPSEDLCVDEDRDGPTWRKSTGTLKSDGSLDDTDVDSAESESIFSRSRSPTLAPSASSIYESGGATDGSAAGTSQSHMRSSLTRRARNAKPELQMNTFQKIIRGISGDGGENGSESCRNCKGQDTSAAWDTVSLLRDENKHLKQRVGDLEVAVDSALDWVHGIGL